MYKILNHNCAGLCCHKYCGSKETHFEEIEVFGLRVLLGVCDEHKKIITTYRLRVDNNRVFSIPDKSLWEIPEDDIWDLKPPASKIKLNQRRS